MSLTRRRLVTGTLGSVLGAAGIYELVDRLSGPAVPAPRPPTRGISEQHVFDAPVVDDRGIPLVIPPRHHAVATARVTAGPGELRAAQTTLEARLERLDVDVAVGWGLPYFRRHVPRPARVHLPMDHRATFEGARPVRALQDAIRFDSDPAGTVLEANDLAVLLRSDARERIDAALRELAAEPDVLALTSIRRGFVGIPKQMALAARIAGAERIPDDAQLFLGFTSTAESTLGRGRIANLETLGYSDGGPEGYFLHGSTMHLSHLFLDLEAWYERRSELARGRGIVSHSISLQSASRLPSPHLGPDGTLYEAGAAIPMRADFNTLDNPFQWSEGSFDKAPAAGLHFVAFHPTSDDFHRVRRAMDRARQPGIRLPTRTTHRQNFLVPPREHRSFPLAELA
jgi:hypothetical protein